MGCDIHAHFEIKVKGEWLHWSQPKFQRSYKLFERMAGVRGDINNAVSPPKGLPSDLNKTTLLDVEYWDSDGHSHSWLDREEIRQVHSFHENLCDVNNRWQIDLEQWGYLFGNGWAHFDKYREDYPEYIEDFRLVFWFDN